MWKLKNLQNVIFNKIWTAQIANFFDIFYIIAWLSSQDVVYLIILYDIWANDFPSFEGDDYLGIMTVKQAAEKWNVTPRRVQEIIREGRIEGVQKIGTTQVMPDDTQKPLDLRLKGNNKN